MIGRNGERVSGISALAARHGDDDIYIIKNSKNKFLFVDLLLLKYTRILSLDLQQPPLNIYIKME